MTNEIRQLCLSPEGQTEVLQGNIAFAVGCVRSGIHAADGYPGTPSTEVIHRGLSQVQDLMTVGWSVNEAVASAVGHGHTLAGRDCVVTMKTPGLFQAGDIFTSGSQYVRERGGLIYYIASDFVPSATQNIVDPRYLYKSCFVPVFEPRNHQEMHEAPAIAVEIARKYNTQVVVMPSGILCHSEGLVRMMKPQERAPVEMPTDLKPFMVLPSVARKNYNLVVTERLPALVKMVEQSPLNTWEKGDGRLGVITYGICDMYVRELKASLGENLDVLSLAFTNPVPTDLVRRFCDSIDGPVYVIEDGYRYVQEQLQQAGIEVRGKEAYSPVTEWAPALIADRLGLQLPHKTPGVSPIARPPAICAGCPFRLFGNEVASLRKKGLIDTVFGDIGCYALLYFLNAVDTSLAMGASEGMRTGFTLSRPEEASRCLAMVGDSTECHTGMAATRNAVYRNIAGVKVVMDNSWTAQTGGQPSPTSPANLAGEPMRFDLPASLAAHGARVVVVKAYDRMTIREALTTALDEAKDGTYTTIVLREGECLRRSDASTQRVVADPELCRKCSLCLICAGIEEGPDGVPVVNQLCSGCGGHTPSCVQMCPFGALKAINISELDRREAPVFPAPPKVEVPAKTAHDALPTRISVGVRGVGGQGILFFGCVLTQLAFLAGYGEKNIVKGETHGMAQMGGPVISTFACGDVVSPVLLPGTADCLIALEKSEVLRPDFLDMLKKEGTVLLATTGIVPPGLPDEDYPSDAQLKETLRDYHVVELDVLGKALELGDSSGRMANVVMLGLLSTMQPFDVFPAELWHEALRRVNSQPGIWAANYAAFSAGRHMAQPAGR